MKITYNWLKDYVDIKVTPERLAHLLTMAGSEVKSIDKRDDDHVFEIEITPNRADCLSMIGIAREVAAITGKKLKLKPQSISGKSKGAISIEIKDKKLCPRYSGRVITGIKVTDSPKWIKDRLKAMGLRPVNNIVDITNYCLFETGQPMHAFDLDKLKGGIVVRRSKKGEKITTIDGVKRDIPDGALIIADEATPIAVAGVMGGLDTEVGSRTKNILLESAYFDPISVRRTSRKLGLKSESSYRFERGVDLEAIVGASNRAAKLVAQLAGGTVGGLTDSGQKKSKTKTITCDVNKAGSLLGVNIPSSKAKTIFKALGFKTTGQGGSLKVTVPSFRPDINYEADATEELARIYGYEKIPTTIPAMVSQSKRKDYRRIIEEKSREILLSAGLSEIITYSLISKEALGKFPLPGVERIDVVNPLSSEQEVMRPTILVGMLGASLWNINRKVEGLQIFEIGNVYFKENGQFKEKLTVSIAATGEIVGNWRNRRKADFFTVKGAVETLLSRLGVIGVNFSFEKVSAFSSRESALVKVKDEPIGTIGKVSQEALSRFDIKQDLYASELDLEKIINMVKLKKYYEPLPKYPFVKRDISILLEAKVHAKDVIGAIGEIGIPQVVDVSVFDEYHGKQVPHGKKSLSFSITYQDKAKTLRDQEVEEAHSRIKSTIASKFSAQFR